eukprot:GHVO01017107.1.p1 GENE.GHVO01017107.1~~GHVO01017107.1.p1  ORF type:complete len:1305 (+),score=265.43 GHVO01017107.1:115-4029(+)
MSGGDLEPLLASEDMDDMEEDTYRPIVKGYKHHIVGTILKYLSVLFVMFTHIVWVIIWMSDAVIPVEKSAHRWNERIGAFIPIHILAYGLLYFIKFFRHRFSSLFVVRSCLWDCHYVQVKVFVETAAPEIEQSKSGKLVDRARAFVARITGTATVKGWTSGYATVQRTQTTGRFFEFMCQRWVYSEEHGTFIPNEGAISATALELMKVVKFGGINEDDVKNRQGNCGMNCIRVEAPSFLRQLGSEFFEWFFIIQIYTMGASAWYRYYSNMVVWICMSVIAIVSSTYIIKRNMDAVKEMTEASRFQKVEVLREDQWRIINSEEVVPGDVLQVTDKMEVPCDMIMLKGQVVCDESSLTGESLPIQKWALPVSCSLFDIEARKPLNPDAKNLRKHMLFAGTNVVTRVGAVKEVAENDDEENPKVAQRMQKTSLHGISPGIVVAVALRTGASTSKGQVLRNILFPNSHRFKYSEQLPIAFVVLFFYALIVVFVLGLILTFGYLTYLLGIGTVSQCTPIWVTTSIAMGLSLSTNRLKSMRSIHTISPWVIPMAGKVRVMCFDKTGTVTRHGIDFVSAHGTYAKKGQTSAFSTQVLADDIPAIAPPRLYQGMMCCHALSVMPQSMISKSDNDGLQKLLGSEMEKKMFYATGRYLEDSIGDDGEQVTLVKSQVEKAHQALDFDYLEVLKVFSFDSERQSMSVIIREAAGKNGAAANSVIAYVKGSYEKIAGMCVSGIPDDLMQIAESHARKGFYVLGLGWKLLQTETGEPISTDRVAAHSRDTIESGLHFEGLLLFRNEVKDESPEAMRLLRDGDIRSVLVTGDNALTAGYVARACNMVRRSPVQIKKCEGIDKEIYERPIILGDVVDGNMQWRNLDTNEVVDTVTIQKSNLYHELAVTQSAFTFLCNARLRLPEDMNDTDSIISEDVSDSESQISKTNGSTNTTRKRKRRMIDPILMRIRIFARMTPEGKINVVQRFIKSSYIVGMCGDGGNDCGALRAAHVGVSMSDTETSVVSPFNAKNTNTTAVPYLIMEGRNILASIVAVFKFLTIYGLIVSASKVVLLKMTGNPFSDVQFMVIDTLILTLFSYAMVGTYPRDDLVSRRPTAALLGPSTILGLVMPHAMNLLFLGLLIYAMMAQPDFLWALDWNQQFPGYAWWIRADNHYTPSVFVWALTQLVNIGFNYSVGGDFRRNVFTNTLLVSVWTFFNALVIYLIFGGPSAITCLFRINCDDATSRATNNVILGFLSCAGGGMPFHGEAGHNVFTFSWKLTLFGITYLNSAVNVLIDRFILRGAPGKYYRRIIQDTRRIAV